MWTDYLATRWVNFLRAVTNLSGCDGPSNLKVQFLTHSGRLKESGADPGGP